MSKQVVVIGGGASGIMAACTAANNGSSVTLLEKNNRIGRKILISGKGRCNLTNYKTSPQELIDQVPVNGRFLYGAFSRYMPQDIMSLMESLGVPLKIERGNRVFPVSDKAMDIVDAFQKYLRQSHVKCLFEEVATELVLEEGHIVGVKTRSHGILPCDCVVVATGGKSYPRTGSTGDGYSLATSVGHSITPLTPSLVPLVSSDECCKELQGLSLKNVTLKLKDKKKKKIVYSELGEMLFTHFGVSGPLVLSASSHIREMEPNRYLLEVDLKPGLSEEQLDRRIQRDFSEQQNKDFQNALNKLLPSTLCPVIVLKSGIPGDKKVHQITREERLHLVSLMKNYEIPISGFRPLEEAIVTSGGVNVKEVNPKTMESKLVEGLYFTGEVLDVDAYTGGYNLQIAFSTGYLAGISIEPKTEDCSYV